MFCQHCGTEISDDSLFCRKCGTALATANPVTDGATEPDAAISPTVVTTRRVALMRTIGITAMVLLTTILLFRRGQIIDRIESVKTTAQSGYDQTASRAKISSALDKIGNHGNDISHATPAVPPLHRELTTEELFKLAAPSVVLVEVFNNSGLRSGTGSGFVAADGAVVTNYHVIRGAYSANVHLQDGSTIPVQGVIGYDQTRDVAVVKASNLSVKTLALGDSEALRIGDRVIAIGSPLAIQNTLSDGLVSGIRNGLIQTSTPISPGSSGGPLFNTSGEVVGITVAGIMSAQNINFAVPINWAKSFLTASDLTSLADLAIQNTVEQPILESTISVPAHDHRAFPILIDRNRMSNPELEGSFSSTGGFGGNIRVLVIGQQGGVLYDSGRVTTGTLRVQLPAGAYQLIIDNSASAVFPRNVTGDFKLHYVR